MLHEGALEKKLCDPILHSWARTIPPAIPWESPSGPAWRAAALSRSSLIYKLHYSLLLCPAVDAWR